MLLSTRSSKLLEVPVSLSPHRSLKKPVSHLRPHDPISRFVASYSVDDKVALSMLETLQRATLSDSCLISFYDLCNILKLRPSDASVKHVFDLYDRNDDGKLDYRDFLTAISFSVFPDDRHRLHFCFMAFDRRNTNTISLSDAARVLGCHLSNRCPTPRSLPLWDELVRLFHGQQTYCPSLAEVETAMEVLKASGLVLEVHVVDKRPERKIRSSRSMGALASTPYAEPSPPSVPGALSFRRSKSRSLISDGKCDVTINSDGATLRRCVSERSPVAMSLSQSMSVERSLAPALQLSRYPSFKCSAEALPELRLEASPALSPGKSSVLSPQRRQQLNVPADTPVQSLVSMHGPQEAPGGRVVRLQFSTPSAAEYQPPLPSHPSPSQHHLPRLSLRLKLRPDQRVDSPKTNPGTSPEPSVSQSESSRQPALKSPSVTLPLLPPFSDADSDSGTEPISPEAEAAVARSSSCISSPSSHARAVFKVSLSRGGVWRSDAHLDRMDCREAATSAALERDCPLPTALCPAPAIPLPSPFLPHSPPLSPRPAAPSTAPVDASSRLTKPPFSTPDLLPRDVTRPLSSDILVDGTSDAMRRPSSQSSLDGEDLLVGLGQAPCAA